MQLDTFPLVTFLTTTKKTQSNILFWKSTKSLPPPIRNGFIPLICVNRLQAAPDQTGTNLPKHQWNKLLSLGANEPYKTKNPWQPLTCDTFDPDTTGPLGSS